MNREAKNHMRKIGEILLDDFRKKKHFETDFLFHTLILAVNIDKKKRKKTIVTTTKKKE